MSENKRKRRWWPLMLVVALLYPMSHGPWVYFTARSGDLLHSSDVFQSFTPIWNALEMGPEWLRLSYTKYIDWCWISGIEECYRLHPEQLQLRQISE